MRCSLLQAPLSMHEPVVYDAHKQAIVTTSAIAFDNEISNVEINFLSNVEINFQFHVCTFNLFHDKAANLRTCTVSVHFHLSYASLIMKVTHNLNGLYRYVTLPLLTFILHDS